MRKMILIAAASAGARYLRSSKGRAKLLTAVPNPRSGRVLLSYELWPA